jgi:hypothetical protein
MIVTKLKEWVFIRRTTAVASNQASSSSSSVVPQPVSGLDRLYDASPSAPSVRQALLLVS